ncbi:hypothetical protein J3R83DRAFT_4892 [Lanmaoa asiatica]|nr:hypothetical protein J3R83DRAFT_4892 [Lanmaoa asiatica]
MNSDIRIIPPEDSGPSLFRGLYSMFTGGWQGLLDSVVNRNPKFLPLDVLPCANVNVDKYSACDKPGKQACSSCKLVSYCSKLLTHSARRNVKGLIGQFTSQVGVNPSVRRDRPKLRADCKDPIRSSNWKPSWIAEGREPSFLLKSDMSTAEEFANRFQDRLSIGASLWGNVPAMDILNLSNNEKDLKRNLSLMFAASGDLRNIVATVNALGSDYSGQLNILLNDLNPYVVSRNITLLLILGTIPDEIIAADTALHFWYSVFMPMEYRLRIQSMVSTLLKNDSSADPMVAPLGPHSTMTCLVSSDVRRLLMENVGPVMSPDQAQNEYKRVRKAPSRADFRDRMYMGLKPSHRLAFLEYRRFGIILPFGALNAHCNVPNPSLFSDGMWLQTDFADPLESWDLDDVFRAGKAHGAQPEDVYGCLYFFLSDQLRAFARHIRQRRISFHVFNSDACALAQGIAQDKFAACGVPSTTRFDRIDVSNIMDPNYAGIRSVMNVWGPLLAKTDNAALTGYFMNWVAFGEKGRVVDAGPSALKGTLELMRRNNRVCCQVVHLIGTILTGISPKLRPGGDPTLALYLAMDDIDTFYDNSKAFSKFWKDNGGADVKVLQLRTVHKIVPHRLMTAVDAKPDALPHFADDETWYRYTRLINRTWTERYVEFGHSKGKV